MEDDMDWDVRLKPQLELVAAGARTVLDNLPAAFSPSTTFTRSSKSPTSPYGDGWDLLWLGHCGEPFPENLDENSQLPADDPARIAMSRKYTISNDVTVAPRDKLTGLIDFKAYPERTRWVHFTAAPICTFAYAVTNRGAERILFDLSVDRLSGPFDNALAWLCRRAVGSWSSLAKGAKSAKADGTAGGKTQEMFTDKGDLGLDMKCLSVTPPLFFHHKAKGAVSGDSDIQAVGGNKDTRVREKGTTENIVWSARNNIRNMLMGTQMESQF
jgi:hypothetical protein